MKLEKGMRIYARFGKRYEAGIILDFADSPDGDYQQVKVELLKENPLSPGQLLRDVYPKPIQSYKLTRRYVTLRGEVQGDAKVTTMLAVSTGTPIEEAPEETSVNQVPPTAGPEVTDLVEPSPVPRRRDRRAKAKQES